MAQDSFSFEGEKPERQAGMSFEGVNLKWKITGTVVGIVLIAILAVAGMAYKIVDGTIEQQINSRSLVIATTLSDAAAGLVLKRNFLELHAFVTKYARLEGVAYAFIQDGNGEVIAHSFKVFPSQLRQNLSSDALRLPHQRRITLQGETIAETRIPILEGQVGSVHIGIRDDVMKGELQRNLTALIGTIIVVLFLALACSAYLARRIVRPIRNLTDIATKISTGELDAPVRVESKDELGELAQSIERMRTSLKAAMWRLSRAS